MSGKNNIETYDTAQILSQMREEYWKGLTEQEEQVHEDMVQLLTFHLAGEFYAVDAIHCKTILKIPNITRVPQTPLHVLGVINVRGRITSVVDLRRLFGLQETSVGPRSRLILVEVGEVATSLVTENVDDIIFKSLSTMKPPARGLTRMKFEFVKGYFQDEEQAGAANKGPEGESGAGTGKELLIYLDLNKIVNSPEMIVDYRAR